jgi:hypothetical protein
MMKLLPVLLLVVLLGACTDSTNTVYVHDLGTYRGKVRQYGIDGNLTGDQTGTTVVILGTSFKAVTDTGGNFTIQNVPAGIYSLLVTKPGYDTAFMAGNQFSGSGTQFIMYPTIQRIPYDSVAILSAGLYPDSIFSYRKDVYILDSMIINGSDTDRRGHTENRLITDTLYSMKVVMNIIGPDSLAPASVRLLVTDVDSIKNAFTWAQSRPVDSLTYGNFQVPKVRPFTVTPWIHMNTKYPPFRGPDTLIVTVFGTVEKRPDPSYRYWLPRCPQTSSTRIIIP